MGEPERLSLDAGQIGFDYRDNESYQGWVLVARTEDGWFVQQVIICGAVEPVEAVEG